MTDILSFLSKSNIHYELNVSGKDLSTFRIGGNLKLVCMPDSVKKISELVRYCKQKNINFYTFGKCSNVVFPDEGINTLIIKTDNLKNILFQNGLFEFGAGVMLAKASKYSVEHGYSGMEFSYGIPGSIGGAVYMNAGAYDGQISDIIEKTEYVDSDGNICMLDKESHDFSYRHSFFFDKQFVITKTLIRLKEGNKTQSEKKIKELQLARKEKQPIEYPSAGSVFKRPEGYFAAKLIEECGLKGKSVGGAMVSVKHAGFIINFDNATCRNVKDLVKLIRDTVRDKFGVDLECEIKFVEDR